MKILFETFGRAEVTKALADRVAAALPGIDVVFAPDDETLHREIVDADAVYGKLTPALLAKAGKLKWLQSPMANPPTGFFFPELVEHPVVVTNMRGIYNDHIATHIITFILTLARGFKRYFVLQTEGRWEQQPYQAYLPASTILFIGVGGVSIEAARYLAPFGPRIIGVDALRTEAPANFEAVHAADQLDALLPEADFVVMTVPLTPETEGFFGADRFGKMKKGSYFVSIGRGKTTRLDALTAALTEGHLAGVAIDVSEIEPLPSDHPLWFQPNAIITPHVAMFGPYLDDRRFEVVKGNCERFVKGEPLVNLVDKARWF